AFRRSHHAFTNDDRATVGGAVRRRPHVHLVLAPTFAATSTVARTRADDRPAGKRNTLLSWRFPGGSLKVVSSWAFGYFAISRCASALALYSFACVSKLSSRGSQCLKDHTHILV